MSKDENLTEIDELIREEAFTFLDDLRDSGIVNMFGAVPYIMDELGLNKSTAKVLLTEYLKQ